MGSGPIIIGDCGGPPPLEKIMRDSSQNMRIGRADEGMADLATKGHFHRAFNTRRIDQVNIFFNKSLVAASSYPASKVDVIGDMSTKFTVQVVGPVIEVISTADLTSEQADNFGTRYVAPDAHIETVLIDDGDTATIAHGNGNNFIRVEIEIS